VWAIFFRHVAEPTQLSQLLRDPQYYLDILFIMLASFILWHINLYIIRRLDRHYSWVTQTRQRFTIQALCAYGLMTLLIVSLALVYHYFVVLELHPLNVSYLLLTELPLNLMFVTIIHLLYTGLWMIHYHKKSVSVLNEQIANLTTSVSNEPSIVNGTGELYKRTLLVNQGKGFVPLSTEQVAYIFIAGEVSFVKTMDGKTYSIDGTLEQLIEQLSPQDFFRISRQFIVQRKAIKKVESETSGRLLLHLQPEHTSEVTVSRRRAPDFRLWMEG
jgi:DNA-binding LytR/AlgR family response regulator